MKMHANILQIFVFVFCFVFEETPKNKKISKIIIIILHVDLLLHQNEAESFIRHSTNLDSKMLLFLSSIFCLSISGGARKSTLLMRHTSHQ